MNRLFPKLSDASFRQSTFWPNIVPLLVGLILGGAIAGLLWAQLWFVAVALAFAIPMAILLQRYPFIALFIWLIVLPLFPPLSSNRFLYWGVHYLLMPLALGLNILMRMLRLKEFKPVKLELIDLVPVIYLLVSVFSILFNSDLSGHQQDLVLAVYNRAFVGFVAYWLIRFLSPREKDMSRLVPLMVILLIIESVVGLVSWFAPDLLPAMWRSREVLFGSRVTGTFGIPGAYTTTLIFTMIIILQYAMTKAEGLLRVVLMVLFAFGSFLIFFSFSRGSWLALILALGVIMLLYPKPILTMIAIAVPALAILSTTLLADEFAWAMQRLETEQTAESRVVLANAGVRMWEARPVFGWGYGSYDLYDWRFMQTVENISPSRWDIEKGTSHNTYLTILAETGLVGLILYALPVLWWLARSVKRYRYLPETGFLNKKMLGLLWSYILFYAVVTQFTDMRFFWYSQGLVWLALGMVAYIMQLKPSPQE